MHNIRKIIDRELDGKTVRNIALKVLKLSAGAFSSLKFSKGILLDGKQAYADDRVKTGQVLEINFPENAGYSCTLPAHPMQLNIAYEDDDYYVLDKPSGLPTMYSPKQGGATLETGLYAHLGCPPDYLFRPVNRLDKGTGGLMVVAKNAHAQQLLQKELHTKRFVRKYTALCKGVPPENEGIIDHSIGKTEMGTKRAITPEGKPSVTEYKMIECSCGMSLLAFTLRTGRTHQIRVHTASIGCPIFGDYLYGEADEHFPGCFALHSSYLSFVHPITEKTIEVVSKVPEMWYTILRNE